MPDAKRLLAAAKRYIEKGWGIIPIRSASKVPAWGKGIDHATRDIKQVERWLTRNQSINIGGVPPRGTAIIDVDIYKAPAQLQPIAKELKALGGPVQFTASGGAHFLFQQPVPPQSELREHFGVTDGIEVKEYKKGYVLLEPSTFDGKPYRWKRGRDEIPRLPSDIINGATHPIATKSEITPKAIPTLWSLEESNKVARALKLIHPDVEYPQWILVGQALHSADPKIDGPAFEAWNRWSSRGDKYKNEADLRTHWKSFKQQGGITLGTLYGMAKKTKPPPDEDDDGEGFAVRALSEYQLEKVDWLLEDVCATGELTLIAGDGGSGKSTFVAALAHTLVHGGHWPAAGLGRTGMDKPSQGEVLMLAQEEATGSGLLPRFVAQGTDVTKIHLLGESEADTQSVRLDEDLEKLETTIKHRKRIVCLIIDPLTGYLGATNQNDESELRDVLQRFVNAARKLKVAVIATMHLSKKIDLDVLNRIMGASAFKNVARHVMAMAPDPDNNQYRYCAVIKTALSDVGLGFVARGHRAPHPKDPLREVRWATIEPEIEYETDVDELIRRHRRLRTERAAGTENMTQWVLTAVNDAGVAGIDAPTLRGLVSTQWLGANEGRELPSTLETMVANTAGKLARDNRILRSSHFTHRGVPQRYFGLHYAELAEIL